MPRALPLITAGDSNYAPGIAVLLWSARRHLNPDVLLDAHVIDGGLGPADIDALENALRRAGGSYRFAVHPAPSIEGVTSGRTTSPLFFARVAIPRLFPDLQQALYMDADIIVKRDLTPVMDLSFDGALAFAVCDCGIPTLGTRGWPGDENLPLEAFNLSPEAPYMNSGFLWMDLNAWRKSGADEETFRLARERADQWVWQDQSVLNVSLYGRWRQLDESWNRQIWINENHWCITPPGPANLHFTWSKPWNFPLDRPIGIVRLFTRCLRESGWPEHRLPQPSLKYPRQPSVLQHMRELKHWVRESWAHRRRRAWRVTRENRLPIMES